MIVPFTSVFIIESVYREIVPLIKLSFLLWGFGMMLMRVCSLPFIIRNTSSDNSTEALSLSASTWSLATIFSGIIISSLNVHSIIVFIGGVFIIYTATREILHMMSFKDMEYDNRESQSVKTIIIGIVVMNLIFSFDSI